MKDQLLKVREYLESIATRPNLPNPERDADWKNCMKNSAYEARQALTILETIAQATPTDERVREAFKKLNALGELADHVVSDLDTPEKVGEFIVKLRTAYCGSDVIRQAITAATSPKQDDIAFNVTEDGKECLTCGTTITDWHKADAEMNKRVEERLKMKTDIAERLAGALRIARQQMQLEDMLLPQVAEVGSAIQICDEALAAYEKQRGKKE